MRCPLQSSRGTLRAARRNLGPTACRNLHRSLPVLGSNPQIPGRWHGYSHEKPVSSSPKGCRERVSMCSENQLPCPTRLRLRTFRLRGLEFWNTWIFKLQLFATAVSIHSSNPLWCSFQFDPIRSPSLFPSSKPLPKQSLPKTDSIRSGLEPTFMAHRSIWPPGLLASLLKRLASEPREVQNPSCDGGGLTEKSI